jgi:hypothetical protein
MLTRRERRPLNSLVFRENSRPILKGLGHLIEIGIFWPDWDWIESLPIYEIDRVSGESLNSNVVQFADHRPSGDAPRLSSR